LTLIVSTRSETSGSAEGGQAASRQALPHRLGRPPVEVGYDLEVAGGIGSARWAQEQETGEPGGALEAFQEFPAWSVHDRLLP
jgi:hypothetical protein